MKRFLSLYLLSFFLVAAPASAYQMTGKGKIQWIENGWFGEGMVFSFSIPISGCPGSANEFAISKDHVGYKEVTSMLIAAYSMQSDVAITVENGICIIGDRTKVISIRVIK
jgi:hypothetical protein